VIKGYNLTNIGTPLKVLFTSYLCVVGIGYMMAFTQILFTHGMADGKFGLSVDDIVYSYYGDRTGTLIENKLNGSMKDMADEPDRVTIIKWVRDGAKESTFESSGTKMVFENNCIACHSADAGIGLPDYTVFAEIKERSKQDMGATFSSLTRVSHIHLFGISFIFFFVGAIFIFAKNVPLWLKGSVIAMPFVSQIMDITSWWLTKFDPIFAWLVLIGGSGMGAAFAFMWFVSVYQMWISKRDDSSVLDES